mgnify:CR=1 FL=1
MITKRRKSEYSQRSIKKRDLIVFLSLFQLRSRPGNYGAFAHLVSPGGGALANLVRPGGRTLASPGRAFDTNMVGSADVKNLRGKDQQFVAGWLVLRAKKNLSRFLKLRFPNFNLYF